MAKQQLIKIFLASPSDVSTERRLVRKVIDELNEVVGREKNIHFDLYSSEHAYPGFGKDGQAIINDQLGNFRTYDIFLTILWNRIGTPTPRAISGTVEEYERAVAARKSNKPDIWVYFRKPSKPGKADAAQQKQVTLFKSKNRRKGLFREFATAPDFEQKLRRHIQTWLTHKHKKAEEIRKKRAEKRKQSIGSGVGQPKGAKGAGPDARNKRTSATPKPFSITSPGKWVLLNDMFHETQKMDWDRDNSITLQIPQKSMEQGDMLRSLHPGMRSHQKQIAFACGEEAGQRFVQSSLASSTAGKVIYTVTLAALNARHDNFLSNNILVANYSSEDIATIYARFILLREPLPERLKTLGRSFLPASLTLHGSTIDSLTGLWAMLHTNVQGFLPKAWLSIAYLLEANSVVDAIHLLELGPIKDKQMRVKFKGRRRQPYHSSDSITIVIEGECPLS